VLLASHHSFRDHVEAIELEADDDRRCLQAVNKVAYGRWGRAGRVEEGGPGQRSRGPNLTALT